MKRKYKNRKKKDLKVGAVLPIYIDYKQEEKFRGNAKLLNKFESQTFQSRYPPSMRSYVRAEVGSGNKYEPQTIIWSWERWRIQFVDGPDKGFITACNIAYYVTTNSYYESGYDRDTLI